MVQWYLSTTVTHGTGQKWPLRRGDQITGTKISIICSVDNNLGMNKGDRVGEVTILTYYRGLTSLFCAQWNTIWN